MISHRKAIVHIGAPKTGTTSIQTFCYKNRHFLSEYYDIFYPDHEQLIRPESGYGHHYIAFHIYQEFFKRITPSYINLNETLNYLSKSLDESKHENLLISCETLLHLSHLSKFKDFTEILSNYYKNLHAILYVRRQDEAILAAYSTNVLMGFAISIDDFIKGKLVSFDYYNLIKLFESMGYVVYARPYDKKYFYQNDLISDFLNVLAIILGKEPKLPDNYKEDEYYLNISSPYFIVQLIAYYNKYASATRTVRSLNKLGRVLIESVPELKNRKWNIIPPSKRREMLNYFEESNRKLAKEYLKLDDLWYDANNIPDSDEEWNKENAFTGSTLYHLCEAVLKAIERNKK